VPFGNSSMHGYWCPTAVDPANAPTIISVNSYDGTAEIDTYVIASAFNPRGFNVLAMEGPGQGYTARFLGLHFFPDYERATSALYDYATTTLAVTSVALAKKPLISASACGIFM
jgi:alpha-beta hydrolase superfamily lysophospholipase